MLVLHLIATPCLTRAQGNEPPGAPTKLLVDLLSEPLGIESAQPLMGWVVNDPDPYEVQTAYQIIVADSLVRLASDEGDVWDSGKVPSGESSNVRYAGAALQADHAYYWKVRTWDKHDQPGPYSQPQMFVTAVKDRWTATSIWASSVGEPKGWHDYTVEVDFTILQNAVGVWLRHRDAGNAYLWQILLRDGQALLRPIVFEKGPFRVLKELPIDVVEGREYRLKVEIEGERFRTFLNGELVDVTVDPTHASGLVGFRQGGTERGRIGSVHVYHAGGTLAQDDFSGDAKSRFTGGTIADGSLQLAPGCQAHLIGEANDDFVFLRTAFNMPDKPVARAIVHVTALSPEPANQYVYRLYLNGRFVGAGPPRGYTRGAITPANRKLDTQSPDAINRYNTFDVTRLLQPGRENVVGSLCYTTYDKRFLFQMRIEYADGTRKTVHSDGTWRALPAGNRVIHDLGNSGHGGYHYAPREGMDARYFPFGWNQAGFDDSQWTRAEEKEAMVNLTASATLNTERHLVSPETVVDKGNGNYFIDFGRNMVAGFRMTLEGVEGHKVEIRLGEELAAPQSVRHRMRTGNTYQEVWTLKDGPQTLENWGYRVFRYAEVLSAPTPLGPSNIRAAELRQPFDDEASHFESSDRILNDVWQLCKHTIKALSLDMYVDTHTRERLNYEGGIFTEQLSDYTVHGEYAFPRFSIEHPYYRPTWPAECRQQSVIMAWQDYLYTGNSDSLRRHYDALKTKTLETFVNADYLVEKAIDAGGQHGPYGRDMVDWPVSELDGFVFTTVNTVVNAHNCKAVALLADIATVLDERDDAARYTELAKQLRRAINTHLFDAEAGKYRDGKDAGNYSQHASAIPLSFGVVEPEHRDAVADYVASRGISGSVYLAQFILDGLYLHNRGEAALDVMTSTDLRSWGNMIYTLGATTTGEAWDPSIKGNMSFSHPWATAPANAIPRGLFGIVPLEPAFARFQIKPQPATLKWAKLTTPSIRGPVSVAFTQEADRFDMTVFIPVNTRATVYVPLRESGRSHVTKNGQAVGGRIEAGYMIFDDVGSGRHLFQCSFARAGVW